MTGRALVVRLDSLGDVLLAGLAVRAVAASPIIDHVVMLCSAQGAPAARLLPGVDEVVSWECPWIVSPAPAATPDLLDDLNRLIRSIQPDIALILTSFHQSPLPLALQLKLAGVPEIVGVSTDYAGSLLDSRLRPGEDLNEDQPEALRALAIASAAGFDLPPDDDGKLHISAVDDPTPLISTERPYVVVHPGAVVPARTWPAERHAATVRALAASGFRVIVTGAPSERDLTAFVAGDFGLDIGGKTDLSMLGGVLANASVVVVGNTGPAHLAAAVGTPIVSLFSPVVPAQKWAPFGVPYVLLGDQEALCRNTRSRVCPIAGHPCLSTVTPEQVVDACFELQALPRHGRVATSPGPAPAPEPGPTPRPGPGPEPAPEPAQVLSADLLGEAVS